MTKARIAVLFDAENINCETAQRVLTELATRGTVQIKKAVGDFSATNLGKWVGCSTEHGIELVLQPSMGKGKNTADIRLTIEAMDIAYQRGINTVALVTRDRDFAPLAHRLRHAGIAVWGFAEAEPNVAFRAACSSFEIVQPPVPVVVRLAGAGIGSPVPAARPAAVAKARPAVAAQPMTLDGAALARLRQIVQQASHQGPIHPAVLSQAIVSVAPELARQLSGKGRFLKTLVRHGIVERVGAGANLLVRAPLLQRVG